MKILLDTHILLWTLTDDPRLTSTARRLIIDQQNEIFYSIISAWEVEIKHESHPALMKIDSKELKQLSEESGFQQVGISSETVNYLKTLTRKERAPDHKDPFDRMLICQAAVNGMKLLTNDDRVKEYTDRCILSTKL